ncbi:hypothetical protein PLICRDRAFT_41303 [Plicaturopsis crispa FD-325 SS-3]|nr:hypothetical protein PLICRDRAFT_41303 [Plicaturopsis crispa FD-325 SS-3]
MTGWKNIAIDEQPSHPLCPKVLQVMQAVYRQADSLNVPAAIDHWWFSPSISYQVDPASLEPSIVIINLREGQPDQPAMDNHFMINLNTKRVHDKFKDERFSAPPEILGVLEEIRTYVVDSVRRQNTIRDKAVRDAAAIRANAKKEQENRVKSYIDRLVEVAGLGAALDRASKSHGVVEKCPLCDSRLLSCADCRVFGCSGAAASCEGWKLDGMRQCKQHPGSFYCAACLAKPETKLTQCSACDDWVCVKDIPRCVGRPLSSASQNLVRTADDSQYEAADAVARQHPTKLLTCAQCRPEIGEPGSWETCDNEGCWSKKDRSAVCHECSPRGGRICLNGHYWTCDTCVADSQRSVIVACPDCEREYCWQCKAIDRCDVCGFVNPCRDCGVSQDYDVGSDNDDDYSATEDDDTPRRVRRMEYCGDCGNTTACRPCIEKGNTLYVCESCNEEGCADCAVECSECEAKLCMRCSREQCRCGAPGPEAMVEMVYGGDDYYDEEY